MAVHTEDGLALIGVDDVDQRGLQRIDELRIVDFRLRGGDGDGIVVDARGHADDVHLVPDGIGAAHAGLAGGVGAVGGSVPGSLIVAAAVSVAHDDVHLLGGGLRERVRIAQLHDVGQVGDLLAVVVLHQPHGRVDVARGGRGVAHGPGRLVEVFPGQLFAGVDLGGQLLAVLGRGGVDQGAVEGHLLVGRQRLVGVAVPGRRVGAVVGQAGAGRGQDDVDLLRLAVDGVGAARQPAHVDGAGAHRLAGGLIAGADGDFDLADVVAQLGHLGLDELRQILGAGDDDVRVLGRDELEGQLVHLDGVGHRGDGHDAQHQGQRQGEKLLHKESPPLVVLSHSSVWV